MDSGKHGKRKDVGDSHSQEKDVAAALLAWQAWKSDDPACWELALSEQKRIMHKNPKAWKQAMRQLDAGGDRQRKEAESLHTEPRDRQVVIPPVIESREIQPLHAQPPIQAVPQPDVAPDVVPDEPKYGYKPYSEFAPPPPEGPAFRAAYANQPAFYGLDLGVLRVGVNSNGSLDLGVDVGIAKTSLQVGLENQVRAELMPHGGPLHARTAAGIGLNRDGIHSEVGAGANFFNLVNGDADFGARIGRNTGVDGDVRGRVWPVDVQANAGAGMSPYGIGAYTGASTGVGSLFGVRSGAQLEAGRNLSTAAGVGVKLGETSVDFGPSLTVDQRNSVQPRLNFYSQPASNLTFYPTGKRHF